ncbi:Rv3654c family TadE-like protein [Saccharopolyspora griseoalba]|uniref:Rv3654c family TadE-like protein n=1 Tax=Saccharopolyspora griseoalba TaxID=1431848 RepID=A0ABW2LHT0_9PSEU
MTALAAVLSLALPALLWFAVQLGAATITRHRAEGAADLAALAAAAHAAQGHQGACGRARRVVEAMGGVLDECRTSGRHARVEVSAPAPEVLGVGRSASARAHSGPVGGHHPGLTTNGRRAVPGPLIGAPERPG